MNSGLCDLFAGVGMTAVLFALVAGLILAIREGIDARIDAYLVGTIEKDSYSNLDRWWDRSRGRASIARMLSDVYTRDEVELLLRAKVKDLVELELEKRKEATGDPE